MEEYSEEVPQLTVRELKQIASTTPEPAKLHVQVDQFQTRQSSKGSPYHEARLTDGTESIIWRIFDNNPVFGDAAALPKGAWIELNAQWVDTGKFGLEPRNATFRPLTEEEINNLLAGDPVTRQRQQQDYADILAFIDGMIDPRLKTLCQEFIGQHGDRFKRAAAAREYHHARRGGLVEHVAQMMRSAAAVTGVYSGLNRDLLLAGVLFHDCGKLWENNYPEEGFTMPHSLHGEMLGHISLGLEVVNKLWRQIIDQPAAESWTTLEPANELVRLHLLHLIASHHGDYQFGSPILPKTPEAIILHHVDNIDAKMEMFRRAYDTGTELGHGIIERVRPLPANVILPLQLYISSDNETV